MKRIGLPHFPASAAAPLAAAMGCLQPGIDPVFLTLLSQASHVPIAAHGLIVGGTQTGAALGSLAVWRLGPLLSHRAVIAAALVALTCSLATAGIDDITAILPIRCCYGLAMGTVYAYAMAAYATRKPNRAFGAVFLIQLVLSTLVSLALPEVGHAAGADVALGLLVLAPASALVALLLMEERDMSRGGGASPAPSAVPAAGWALAAATFWFICATMLIWSFSAGLATAAGIADRTIGHAVAIGSISGALTALAVMREKLLVPLPVTGLLAGAALVSPMVLTAPGADAAFVVSIILLNIGSTAIIIRCSGLAAASSTDSRFRTFVACTHSLGLIAGPTLGTLMMALFGPDGLLAGLLAALVAGLGSVVWAALAAADTGTRSPSRAMVPDAANTAQIALD
ncbi:hypothetical protein GCM10009087_11510 [Sphingomonas oligophenolica]|uniref:MFS transporter n=1 Tax=Sphingomonas oligophenolica TaxID=301154 RepID=A0ABU9Y425_9SPHN